MSEPNDIWKKYQKIDIIGSGTFGNVYRAKYNNKYFAIKEIEKINLDKNKFLSEIEVMKKMECDNCVKIIESIETKESFYVVSELCCLNLAEYLKKRKRAFQVEEIKELLIDLNKGLKVMYENKIIHGNIKPSNILFSFNKNNVNKLCLKLSDFGLSEINEENIIDKNRIKDTSEFISPECLKGEEINDKSDIWSLYYYLLLLYSF